MTFIDPWLTDDSEALTAICYVEVYGNASSAFGPTAETPNLLALSCLEQPPRQVLDREQGVLRTIPMQLLIEDVNGVVEHSSRIQYNGERYQVQPLITSPQNDLVRVRLEKL